MRLRAISVAGVAAALFSILFLTPHTPVPSVHAEEPKGETKRPVPTEKTNCVVCHLSAGRELTDAVHTFALSVHDANGLSCNDCHGGNTEDDTSAHEGEFGFIGTKLSSHLEACIGCHEEPAADFAKGPHHWNHSERINIDYPLCIDCHGNHDVGNPPPEFSMSLVCTDCHENFSKEYPAEYSLTESNDKLWASIRKWRAANPGLDRVPEELSDELGEIRSKTAAFIHAAQKVNPEDAQTLNKQVEEFRKKLDASTQETAK